MKAKPPDHIINAFVNHPDSSTVGTTLILAGFVPSWFNSNVLSTLYFAFLIPPAAWHCWGWFRRIILPTIKKWFKIK